MPLVINNDFVQVSLRELVEKQAQGYSVVRSPHVGNQHPSNLVCAKLGIPLSMVTFTRGERDANYHPHLRIEQGVGTAIANPSDWTPFAKLSCGGAVETFHQQAVADVFPHTLIQTDMEIMQSNRDFTEVCLRVLTETIPRLWYRRMDVPSEVYSVGERYEPSTKDWNAVAPDVFRFSSEDAGWIVPNVGHILTELVLQSLESGRSAVYHLAGPQMVGYVGGRVRMLSLAYDALRAEWSGLPETLTVYIVPVSQARMLAHVRDVSELTALEEMLQWYESLPPAKRRYADERIAELVKIFPQFTTKIETATCLSQYDLASADDLLLSEWMLDAPLGRVRSIYQKMCKLAEA